ncbi:hypothetical protein M5D96_006850, partial [Drosophila gunungcola]
LIGILAGTNSVATLKRQPPTHELIRTRRTRRVLMIHGTHDLHNTQFLLPDNFRQQIVLSNLPSQKLITQRCPKCILKRGMDLFKFLIYFVKLNILIIRTR